MNYKDLSDNSRVWVYQSDREFTAEEVEIIKPKGKKFLETWNSHGATLDAAFEIFFNRFIVIFADEDKTSASGCSIDTSVHFIRQIENDFGVSLFNRMNIAYKEMGKIFIFHFNELDKLLKAGKINENTIMFNNLVSTKKEFLASWEIPLKESWIKERPVS